MKKLIKNISSTSFLFIAMILVNAGNYAINLGLGRFLSPAAFSEASVIATMVLMLSFIAVGIQLSTAKFSAEEKDDAKRNKVVSWFNQKVTHISIAVSLIMVMASPFLKSYLHFESSTSLLIIAVGLPFFFNLSIKRGSLQGTDQFNKLAGSYLIEMSLRLVVTLIALLLLMKSFGLYSTEAVALGFLVSFLTASFFKLEKAEAIISPEKKASISKFILVIGLYELSQIVINNSDVIMAKHFFDAKEAGLYAAIALIGRVVYFGTWTIVTLLFPKVIQRERDGLPHEKLFWTALLMVGLIGILIVAVCFFIPEFIITILFGAEYLQAADLLWIYAVSTTLFACANVFAYYHMSLSNYLPVGITLFMGFLQLILINQFHDSLYQIIQIQLILMSSLLLIMIFYQKIAKQVLDNKFSRKTLIAQQK